MIVFEFSVKDQGEPGWNAIFSKEKEESEEAAARAEQVGMERLGREGQRVYTRMKVLQEMHFRKPEPYTEMEVLDREITLKEVKTEEEVIEAIRCIYSEYGYSYAYERLYYADSFLQLVKDRELVAFLAVNAHGQTAGYFALAFSQMYKDMPEISTVVVRRPFRGMGLFSLFMKKSEEIAKKLGCRALMGQPVAYHTMSQKAFLRDGFTPTSMLLNYIESDLQSEYNRDGRRLPLCVAVKILDFGADGEIFPPHELQELLSGIYGRLGFAVKIHPEAEESSVCMPQKTEATSESSSRMCMTRIVLRKAGEDLPQMLKQMVRKAIHEKDEMIELAIFLNDRSCPYGCHAAVKCGFSLSGVIPGGADGDYLIFQMTPGDVMDCESLVLEKKFANLRDEITAVRWD